MRVIIAGGGTGGHIYPGIAIAQEFRRRNQNAEVIFVGTARGLESRIVPREGFRLELIDVAALKRVSMSSKVRSLVLLPRSFAAVRRVVRAFRPEVVIGVGGYASGPVVLTAALMGVPTMIAEQNAHPGFTNRVLARFVKAAALSFEEAKSFFGTRGEVTGNPVREEFFEIGDRKTGGVVNLLITGGSQGARAINDAMIGALVPLAAMGDRLSIVHQSGESDFERVRAAYAARPELRAEVKPFIEQMSKEFEKSDLVICRAGATTVAELAAAGRGAIFIPFPYAADDHQRKNAEAVARAGAGRVILQAELTAEKLANEVSELVSDPAQLEEMAKAGRKLARRDAAKRVVDLAMRVGSKGMK